MYQYNPFSLEGKTVLVTGASSGIGRATAIECSKLGATLVLTGRNENALQELTDPVGVSLNHSGNTVEGLRELQSAMYSLKKTLENEVGGLSRQIKIAV